jgi:5-hydroxytryptamine receptor 7
MKSRRENRSHAIETDRCNFRRSSQRFPFSSHVILCLPNCSPDQTDDMLTALDTTRLTDVLYFLAGPSENLPICEVNSKLEYQIFATMLSFYIPLIVVLIIYANIYRTAQTAMDTRSSVQMSQFLTHNTSSANFAQTARASSKQQLNGESYSTPQLYLGVSNTNANNNDDNSSVSGGQRSLKRSGNSPQRSKSPGFLSPTGCLGRRISTSLNGRLSTLVPRRTMAFRHVHLPNQKAIRTLGVILGTFIVCWLPFMSFAIFKPLYERITGWTGTARPLNAPRWVDPVLLWFGYVSSMLNPIIYSKFNREFRTPFREIICCRCRGLNEKIRRQEYLENLYGDTHLQPPLPAHLATSTRNSSNPEPAAV